MQRGFMASSKIKLKEAIVLEGRDDLINVSKYFESDFILTHGYHISDSVFKLVDKKSVDTGVIIFTDPDRAGELIRKKLAENSSGIVKHAYITKEEARCKSNIGVENASKDAIIDAVLKAKPIVNCNENKITYSDLLSLGLSGSNDSKVRRKHLSKRLRIGLGNTKHLLRSLNSCNIELSELKNIMEEISDK